MELFALTHGYLLVLVKAKKVIILWNAPLLLLNQTIVEYPEIILKIAPLVS
jgi:hypothetical protein